MPSKDANNSLTFYSNLFTYTKQEFEESTKSNQDMLPSLLRKKNLQKSRRDNDRQTTESLTLSELKHAGIEELQRVNALDDSIMQRLKLTSLKKTEIDYTSSQIDAEVLQIYYTINH